MKRVHDPYWALVGQVIKDHDLRLDEPRVTPKPRKPFKHRPRPKTAIIADACERKQRKLL